MDIRMPGMDGIEAARRIWQQLGRDEVRIVARVGLGELIAEVEQLGQHWRRPAGAGAALRHGGPAGPVAADGQRPASE
jgi:CheY-like chemotaxis protein